MCDLFALWQCDRWFYIDDGPLFETLPHVIDHYSRCADGLPVLLKTPVPPDSSPPRSTQNIAPPPMRKRPGMLPATPPLSSAVSTPVLSMSPGKSPATRIPLQRAESAVSDLSSENLHNEFQAPTFGHQDEQKNNMTVGLGGNQFSRLS